MIKLKRIVIGLLIILALGLVMGIIDNLFGITYSNSIIEISYKTLTGLCLIGCSYTGVWMLEKVK